MFDLRHGVLRGFHTHFLELTLTLQVIYQLRLSLPPSLPIDFLYSWPKWSTYHKSSCALMTTPSTSILTYVLLVFSPVRNPTPEAFLFFSNSKSSGGSPAPDGSIFAKNINVHTFWHPKKKKAYFRVKY